MIDAANGVHPPKFEGKGDAGKERATSPRVAQAIYLDFSPDTHFFANSTCILPALWIILIAIAPCAFLHLHRPPRLPSSALRGVLDRARRFGSPRLPTLRIRSPTAPPLLPTRAHILRSAQTIKRPTTTSPLLLLSPRRQPESPGWRPRPCPSTIPCSPFSRTVEVVS